MTIPPNLLAQLEMLCEAHDFGMLVIQGEEHTGIIMGHRRWSPDQISIVMAYNLLRGVISSEINEKNQMEQDERANERKM